MTEEYIVYYLSFSLKDKYLVYRNKKRGWTYNLSEAYVFYSSDLAIGTIKKIGKIQQGQDLKIISLDDAHVFDMMTS